MTSRFLTVLVLAAAISACKSNTPTSPSQNVNVPYSATDLQVGTGAEAVNGRTATITCGGWLYDANAAQNKGQSFNCGTFSFVVGSSQVIPGFNQAVTGMRVGGQRRAIVPPNLAYGSAGSGPIPPNATLVFDIELLNVQ
jgi:FKBP-type peptidyl-prolyl cis-trans isomerase FkpA